MALDVPDLGDRDYAAYVETARSRIPVHAESWTDHNVHDPGVTILETLAWLAETYVYQLDRFGERQIRKYLRLVGSPPRPPRSASVLLRLSPPADGGVDLPWGTVLAAGPDRRTALRFETTAPEPIAPEPTPPETTVSDPTLPAPTPSEPAGTDPAVPVESVTLVDARLDSVVSDTHEVRTDNSVANTTDGTRFFAFGPDAEAGSAMYLGFDGDPFPETGAATPPKVALGVAFDETGLPTPATHGEEPPEFEPSVELDWEYCVSYDRWYATDAWEPLPVVFDDTNRLYESGIVVFERPTAAETAGDTEAEGDDAPRPWPDRPGPILNREDGRYWIRCVVRTPGYEIPPRLERIALNVVPATHRTTVRRETLRRADGREETTAHPGQVFTFERDPVLYVDLAVVSDPDDPDELTDPANTWTRVDDFDAAGPDDRAFVLEESAGTVTFGDEVAGATPTAGRFVVAKEYVYGGGSVGNVRRTVPWRFVDDEFADVAVSAFDEARGGADAETVEAALARVRRDLQTPYRAVTAEDYRAVALSTPGLRFGRARATVVSTPDSTPGVRGEAGTACEGRGTVEVVVVPHGTRPRPVPSPGFLEAVRCHLLEHALLTDRVRVDPPSYVGVGVAAVVRLNPDAAAAERTTAIAEELDAFLDPLLGFEGDGWPFGRPVYRSEVYEVIEGVEGVDCVLELSLSARGAGRVTPDGDVELDETGLTYPLAHDVAVRVDRDECGEES